MTWTQGVLSFGVVGHQLLEGHLSVAREMQKDILKETSMAV